jgi:hypothetical protein
MTRGMRDEEFERALEERLALGIEGAARELLRCVSLLRRVDRDVELAAQSLERAVDGYVRTALEPLDRCYPELVGLARASDRVVRAISRYAPN